MNKAEFISRLKRKLSEAPEINAEECLQFYEELIDDKIEEGKTEEIAIFEIGSIDEVYAKILENASLYKMDDVKISEKRKIQRWEIALIIVGSPIWFSLIIAAISVVFSLYVSLWSVVVAAWAVFVAFAVTSPVSAVIGGIYIFEGYSLFGFNLIACALVLAGLSIFVFCGALYASKGAAIFVKKSIIYLKKFSKKGEKR